MTTLNAAKNDTHSVDPARALSRGTLVAVALASGFHADRLTRTR
jgi:hypothetical protein